EIERDRETVWKLATGVDVLPDIILATGPIPGVRKAYVVGGGETRLGAVRRLVMTDGTPLDEEITAFEAPRKMAYTLKGFRGPLAAITERCEGQWVFSPLGSGTRVSWTFTAHLRSPLVAPAAALVLKVFMKRAMESSLAALRSRAQLHT
ncbi:MAG: SRPBCC family protein, partial [Deltaproteobacteria bacterium]